ncbi:Uncharacterized protein dnm_087640 [Desulfonema magnum]|uniref:Uncharacterized protein n=1 Tax=Desulfonema magnum TaxID=45655 RepID=A0A975BWJ7_9BACT|nr:Uncharacterized protein dnm_087640 [Desulfonema magnum]
MSDKYFIIYHTTGQKIVTYWNYSDYNGFGGGWPSPVGAAYL